MAQDVHGVPYNSDNYIGYNNDKNTCNHKGMFCILSPGRGYDTLPFPIATEERRGGTLKEIVLYSQPG